jgi:DNA transformation protein
MRQGDQLVDRSMNYYCPPDEAMDAPDAMAPWARLAWQSALAARAALLPPKPRRPPAKKAAARKTAAGATRKAAAPRRRSQG